VDHSCHHWNVSVNCGSSSVLGQPVELKAVTVNNNNNNNS
jgi:hypothetical protein